MSALARFGPVLAKSSAILNPTRQMATVSASDPIQKLFADKIKEFKSSNQGLDAAHQKAMTEEMARLRRVYKVEDDAKLAHMDHKFSAEHNVSLHDIDTEKERRHAIATGEYQKQLTAEAKPRSALLDSIPEQVTLDMHLPPLNKPSNMYMYDNMGVPKPTQVGDEKPDYHFIGESMTPHRLQRDMNVMFGPEMPTIHDDSKPGRDVVNFPRLPRVETPPATRYHFVPESWFRFFHPKTGVTGPYIFAGALSTFLLSKELIIWEHELLTGVTSSAIFAYAVINYGPKITTWIHKKLDAETNDWEEWRKGNIKFLETVKTHYNNQMNKSDLIQELYNIRGQDVEMQLEHEHRNRLKSVYDDTRRRLNYLVSVADSQRQIAHKNMVNWVIGNAVSSIGQKQENEVLENCISNLKQLGAKNSNAI